MAVLVAGGTGALGGAVVRELVDAGYACALTWVVARERARDCGHSQSRGFSRSLKW